MKGFLRFSWFLYLLVLAGCGREESTALGGTGTDAGESTARYHVNGKLQDASGRAVVNALVILRSDLEQEGRNKTLAKRSLVLDSTRSNANGLYSVGADSSGHYMLEFSAAGIGGSSRFFLYPGSVLHFGLNTLYPPNTLTGRVTLGGTGVGLALVEVLGLERSTSTLSDGSFEFSDLPVGNQILRISSGEWQSDFLWIPEEGFLDFPLDRGGILFENFESGKRETRVGQFLDGNSKWWFAASDDSARTVPGSGDLFGYGLFSEKAWQGNSFSIRYEIPVSEEFSYGIAGFDLGKKDEDGNKWFYDLSNMQALVFWARGAGSIHLQFDTWLVEKELEDYVHFMYEFDLSLEWTKVRITPEMIVAAPGSVAEKTGRVWWEASDKVSALAFLASDNAEFFLDDIVFEGIKVFDLLHATEVK